MTPTRDVAFVQRHQNSLSIELPFRKPRKLSQKRYKLGRSCLEREVFTGLEVRPDVMKTEWHNIF